KFTIDSIAPNINITFPVNGTTVNNTANINFTASDSGLGLSSCWYSNDTNSKNISISCTTNITGFNWNIGWHNVTVWVNDSVNNVNFSRVIFNVTGSSVPPNVSFSEITNIVNNGNYSGVIVLNVSVIALTGTVSSVYFNVTNSSGQQKNYSLASNVSRFYYLPFTTSNLTDGMYNITVYANDTSGNLNNTQAIQITIDNTPPTGSYICSPSSVNWQQAVSCSCSSSDVLSGINSSAISYAASPDTSTSLGTFTVNCIFYDLAGNIGNATTTYTVNSPQGGTTSTSQTTTTPAITAQSVNNLNSILPGTPSLVNNFDPTIGVKDIQIQVNNEADNVQVNVIKYSTNPESVPLQTDNIYGYLQVQTQNLVSNLKKAIMEIQVNKSWVSNHSLTKDDISIFKYNESSSQWNALNTTYENEDNSYYYYNTELHNFSYFAIGQKIIPSQNETTSEIVSNENSSKIWAAGVIILILGIISVLLIKKRKKLKRH
ncbi:MAG TPA: PGF-pre-PGF domain-containing protein, partial [Patescibacteria group bacterium]|nr:PGF-pre-PGF domain-containing protein [Patescibacteria group bacterium]